MKRILFVCTGNTCRSPMAEAIFNSIASDSDFVAYSAGLYAISGAPISQNAKEVLLENGIEFQHFAKQIDQNDIKKYDYIFGMTTEHAKKLLMEFPEAKEKVYVFPAEVSDPFLGNINIYRDCFSQIKMALMYLYQTLVDAQ